MLIEKGKPNLDFELILKSIRIFIYLLSPNIISREIIYWNGKTFNIAPILPAHIVLVLLVYTLHTQTVIALIDNIQ